MDTLNTDVVTPEVVVEVSVPPVVIPPVIPPIVAPEAPRLSAEDVLRNNPELQAFVNKITGDARKEGREKGKKELLDAVGVSDTESIKSLLDQERIRKEAEMTEQQRLQSQIDALKIERDTATQHAQTTQDRMKRTLLDGEISKQAREHKFIDVFDLKSRLDTTTIDIDLETGSVTGVDVQATAIAKNVKHLIEQSTPIYTPNPVPPTPQPPSTKVQADADENERRKNTWRPR